MLVPPLLVPPLLRLQALVPGRVPGVQRQPHRHFYFIDCPRKFLVFGRCVGFEKALDYTRVGYHIVQSTLLLSFFQHRGIQGRTFIRRIAIELNNIHFNSSRHNLQLWSLCPLSGLSFNALNWVNHSAQGATISFMFRSCKISRSFAFFLHNSDKLVAQLNGCVSSTSQVYAPRGAWPYALTTV